MKSKLNSNMKRFMQGRDIATVLFGEKETPDRTNLSEAIYLEALTFQSLLIEYEIDETTPDTTIQVYDFKRGIIWQLLMEAYLIWNQGEYEMIPSIRFMCDWVYRRTNLARN